MTSNTDDEAPRRAIEQLEALGLSAYAARTFVGLVTLGGGTAKEISDVVNVPRTRVYDAAEELTDRGIATIESSSPRRFHPLPIERAIQVLSTEYTGRIDSVVTDLEALSGVESSLRRDDVWLITGVSAIVDQTAQFLDAADETVVFATASAELSEMTVDRLVDAAERGVTVRVAGLTQRSADRLESVGSAVQRIERPWDSSSIPLSTVLIVDGQRSLVTLDREDPLALWSADEPNTLLVLLRAFLGVSE